MTEDGSQGSVSGWIADFKQGQSAAGEQLWNRYFSQLVQVALARLRSLTNREAAEDVALSAMKSALMGIQAGRFPSLADRNGLWPLLVTITARKSVSELRKQTAGKRRATSKLSFTDVAEYIGSEPTAEFAVEVADELEHLWQKLNDETLRSIVELKLEGRSHEEIAVALACSTRTIIRKLDRIRKEWEASANSQPAKHPKV